MLNANLTCVGQCDAAAQTPACLVPSNLCQPFSYLSSSYRVGGCVASQCTDVNDCGPGDIACAAGICIPHEKDNCTNQQLANGSSCAFTYASTSYSGKCLNGYCQAECSAETGTACENDSSVCQATGQLGATGTASVCVPATCAGDSDCPAGSHGCAGGACVMASQEPCEGLGLPNGDACSFAYNGTTYSGKCFADVLLGTSACMQECTLNAGCDEFGATCDDAYLVCVEDRGNVIGGGP